MPILTEEQISKARSVDLLDYLQTYEPSNVRPSKGRTNEHYMVEHDSLKMSNGKWFRHSTQEGGYSALDFLIKVRGAHFVDAVLTLTGGNALSAYKTAENNRNQQSAKKPIPQQQSKSHQQPHQSRQPPSQKQQQPQKPFVLPKPNRNNDRVLAYLRGRGIERDVIHRCIKAGILYESSKHTCVFVGNDENSKARFAFERSMADDTKKDVSGSSKKYGFCLPPKALQSEQPTNSGNEQGKSVLAVFESPVDALAHASVHEIGQTGWDGHRLSLGGVSSAALNGFLERNPQITAIQLCLDNDRAGQDATKRIITELLSDKRYSQMKITVAPPPIGKDYADTMLAIKQNCIGLSDINRQKQAAF